MVVRPEVVVAVVKKVTVVVNSLVVWNDHCSSSNDEGLVKVGGVGVCVLSESLGGLCDLMPVWQTFSFLFYSSLVNCLSNFVDFKYTRFPAVSTTTHKHKHKPPHRVYSQIWSILKSVACREEFQSLVDFIWKLIVLC